MGVYTALFYDTETTGFIERGLPLDDAKQPHVVQLAAALVDVDNNEELASVNLTVSPDGWTIPTGASDVHGITTEFASRVGISELLAVRLFIALWRRASVRVAHNEAFDARIIEVALCRFANRSTVSEWKQGRAECTADQAAPIIDLPPTDRMVAAGFGNKPKTPNLAEALAFFTGHELKNAHTALADCIACKDIWFALRANTRMPGGPDRLGA